MGGAGHEFVEVSGDEHLRPLLALQGLVVVGLIRLAGSAFLGVGIEEGERSRAGDACNSIEVRRGDVAIWYSGVGEWFIGRDDVARLAVGFFIGLRGHI